MLLEKIWLTNDAAGECLIYTWIWISDLHLLVLKTFRLNPNAERRVLTCTWCWGNTVYLTVSDLHMMLIENVCSQGRVRLLLEATHLYTGPMWALVNLERRKSFQNGPMSFFCLKKTIIREKSGKFWSFQLQSFLWIVKVFWTAPFSLAMKVLSIRVESWYQSTLGGGSPETNEPIREGFYINLCLNNQWMSLLYRH
jgi:hypothetical protein